MLCGKTIKQAAVSTAMAMTKARLLREHLRGFLGYQVSGCNIFVRELAGIERLRKGLGRLRANKIRWDLLARWASVRPRPEEIENSSSKSQAHCHQHSKELPIRWFHFLFFLHSNLAQLDLEFRSVLLQRPAPESPFLHEHEKYRDENKNVNGGGDHASDD